ncbi:MAG TPA: family 43 glycosylhydrolase [Propionibacteriaceae bacterium]
MINVDPAAPTTRPARTFRPRSPLLRVGAVLVAGVLAGSMFGGTPRAEAEPSRAAYVNPVSQSFADTFADPSIIEGKDSWWYAYSTADPLRAGDEPGIMHIARTRDFVSWNYQGTVFDDTNRPVWATAGSGLWAPDVRYINGQYVIYFTVTDTTADPRDNDSAIGIATAPTPVGPWTPGTEPVVAPRPGNGSFLWTFDPSGFTDVDGQRYLYYGSYNGGVYVTRVSADGLTAVGEPTMVAIDNRFEGSYVVRHGGYYYLMASSADCCAGPVTGYSVLTGRSRSPMGPFVDADGIGLTASKAGGTILVTQNSNRWIGAGHHAVMTDHAGRDFLVYHALDRDNAWLAEPFGITRRPMLLDRIDWVDGWPRVRAGAGPSDTAQPTPVTGSDLGIIAADPAAGGFTGLRQGPTDTQGGAATARLRGTATTQRSVKGDSVRLRLDVDTDRPFAVDLGRGRDRVQVRLEPAAGRLRVTVGDGRTAITRTARTTLAGEGWRTLVVEIDRGEVLAQLSEDDLGDPYAEVRVRDRGFRLRSAPVRLTGADATLDNVSVRPLAEEAARLVAVPRTRSLISTENFDGPLSDDWSWVRENAGATVSDGRLRWPVENADLTGTSNNAGVLLHNRAPEGTWIVETKLRLDLGEDQVRNFQQAGLVAYVDDDDFARLSSVAIWNTRQTEFGREKVVAPDGRTRFGGAIIGTPDATVWLRLAHTRNAAGEHLYRAATSRDGKNWTWGAVWIFDAKSDPRIGLVAHGGAAPALTAEFDHLRFYRASWPVVDRPGR